METKEEKEYKFVTPVSMAVTQDQFDNDLKEPLEKIGYKYGGETPFKLNKIISVDTGYYDSTCVAHVNWVESPQLFLALAAMSDKPEGIPGEWWKCMVKDSGDYYGHLYMATSVNKYINYIGENGEENFYFTIEDHLRSFRKATKEEIMEHFNKPVYFLCSECQTNDPNNCLIVGECPFKKFNKKTSEESLEQLYRLLKTYESPTGKIHVNVEKTAREWMRHFPFLYEGDCAIKTDWFKPVETRITVTRSGHGCTFLEKRPNLEWTEQERQDIEHFLNGDFEIERLKNCKNTTN